MDFVNLFIDGIYVLYLGSFIVGIIIGALILFGLLIFPKTTIHWLEKFLRYGIECNEKTLKSLEEFK